MGQRPDEINHRQYLFCLEYIKDYNGKRSYIAAGYSENGAAQSASELLTKPNIIACIEELEQERLTAIRCTGNNVLAEIKRIGEKAEAAGDFGNALRAKDLLGRVGHWKRSEGKTSAEVKANGAEIKITFDDKPDDPS